MNTNEKPFDEWLAKEAAEADKRSLVEQAIDNNADQEISALFADEDETLPCPVCEGACKFDYPGGPDPNDKDIFGVPCRKCDATGRVYRDGLSKEEINRGIEIQNRTMRAAMRVAFSKLEMLKAQEAQENRYHYQIDDAMKVLEEAA